MANTPKILINNNLMGESEPERVYNVEAVDQITVAASAKKHTVIYLGLLDATDKTDPNWQSTLNAEGASKASVLFQDATLKTGYTIRDGLDRDWRYVEDLGPVIRITAQPQSANVTAGSISGSLSVVANSSVPSSLSYQWYINASNSNSGGTPVGGATSATFTITTTLTAGTYYYYVQISGSAGEAPVKSNTAAVTVASAGGVGNVMQDLDGNTYNTVQVGTLLWTTTNYKYTGNPAVGVFHNGLDNANATPGTAEPFTGAGRLYTWTEADTYKPSGWRLPSETEWTALQTASQTNGATGNNGLKSTTLWPTANGVDTLGFNALPAGYRGTGNFQYIQPYASPRAGFWTSTQNQRVFIMDGTNASLNASIGTGYIMSVRYVKQAP